VEFAAESIQKFQADVRTRLGRRLGKKAD